MSILIVHTAKQAPDSIANLISAAAMLGDDITLLMIGQSDIQVKGIKKIIHYTDPTLDQPSAKMISDIITKHAQGHAYILANADTTGKDFLPYYCGQTMQPMLSDIIEIISDTNFKRAIYAGAAHETVSHTGDVKIMSIRSIYFTSSTQTQTPEVETIDTAIDVVGTKHISSQAVEGDFPDLNSADIVVSGGRGVDSKEGFDSIYTLAKHFNAAVGASRAAVDCGYIGNEHQVGQTGKIIAPRIYMSFGISGAVQHLSGMKDAQTIIAIDKDPNAPIFQVAHYGYCGDLFEAIKALKKFKLN